MTNAPNVASRIKRTRRLHPPLPLSLFSFMLRVVFALHCVVRRACRPVTPRSQIQRAPRQMSTSIDSSSFSGGRSPTSIYGMRLPPFGPFSLPASKQLSYHFPHPPLLSLAFLSPIFLSFSKIDAKLLAQSNIGAYILLADYHRRPGAASTPGARMKEWSIDV